MGSAQQKQEDARRKNLEPRNFVATAVGGAMLGTGMAICGACPGTVAVQVGAGLYETGLTIMSGGLLAALSYSLLEPKLRHWTSSKPKTSPKQSSVDRALNCSFWKVALVMAGGLAGVVALLENYFPWYTQVGLSEPPFPSSAVLHGEVPLMSLLKLREWPAYVAGAGIGLLQLPLITMLRQTIGTSSSYVTCVANTVCAAAPNSDLAKNQYLQRKKHGYWQVGLVGGVMAGAFLSSHLSGSFASASALAQSPLLSLLGGFLIVGGSRLADGCTSGHGISGMSSLALTSFVAVPAMFAAGIATSFIRSTFF
mmetsp:Transcript_42376/g.106919  ORF Transcript_42376/g.106919 Transcript_42376/m.106919 type:complete len:311 (+) Transcript_42376:140-1072(+)